MANLKKYNTEAEQWEVIASDSASVIHSEHTTLLSENQQSISVEDALVRDREDIELMKKNISWLALHGGNGSGGGGGMVEVTDTIEILDENNNIISTDTIWRKTSKTLRYRISSSKASNKFDVTISLDGAVIRKDFGIAQGDSRQISIENINRYSKNNTHTFAVSAVGMYDDSVRKSVSLNQVNLTLGKTTNNYTTSSIEIDNNGTLSIRCNSSIPDDYILYWGDSIDIFDDPAANSYGFQQVRIDNSFDVTLAIPYWNDIAYSHLLKNKLVSVGQTLTFYFVLVNTNDFTIKSEMLEINVTVISPDRIAITPISLSSNKNAPTKISKASILNSNFIAYLKTESTQFTYNVAAYKVEWNENTSDWDIIEEHQGYIGEGIGQYEVAINVTYNALPNDSFFDGGNTYMLIISAYDSFVPSNMNTARCYMEIQSAVNTQIPINADGYKVFDFKVWGSDRPDANWVWTSVNNNYTRAGNAEPHAVTTTANFVNMGGKSEMGSAYARLTNKAHMIINNSKLDGNNISWFPVSGNESTTGLIPSANPQFTLSICFYNDFTPDDDRTIFNYGNYHPKTATEHQYGRGILINNHDIYVNIGGELTTCKIQDSIYHEIDFVFGRNSSGNVGTTMLEIYHNGILLAVNKKVRSAAVFSDFYGIDEMTLACNKQNNTLSQFTNINLQAISLYSIALNPLQIVCNYINHLVTYELDNNNLNTQLLTEKLESNLITIGDNGKISCPLWTFNSQGGMLNDFDDSNWVIIDANNGIIPKQDLLNICPIPIVVLDFSAGNNQLWTWENFSTEWSPSTKLEDTTAKMYYYAAHNGTSVLSDSNGNGIMVNVGGQGTTSITYAIKNLNIDFGDSYLFWAKQSWFPEKVYTLKADVVDSAHANNATIGKFVNTCAENTSLLEFTPPMQYFHNNKNTQVFEDLPDAAKDATNGVSIKHTLEGFPVLLIAKFCSDNPSQADVKSLGIYSFNLGRDAYYNLGYQILKRFKFPNGNVVTSDTIAPCLLGAPNLAEDIIDFEAQSWEGHDSINCTKKTENTADEINASSGGNGYIGSVNEGAPVELNGYFWSSKINHINHFWDLRYPKTGSITAQNGFQDLCKYLVKMPYDKGDFIIRDGAVYEYDWDISRDEMYVPEQLTGVLSIDRQNLGSPLINVPNAVFYYVICMMFGLVDSLGKNLNMRIWKNTHINNLGSYWFTCFYDMDTALGIDNFGQQVVAPDVIDEKLVNEPNLNRKFLTEQEYDDTSKIYTVFNNKLWGILDERTFKDQLQGIGGGTEARNSLYASAWNVLRSNYLRSVDEFMDTYFGKQTEGVGEMLYNQDFNVKYINTEQFGFMYGDRKAFVRDWMRKRIAFLDSYFGYLQSAGGGASSYLIASGIKDCSYQNKIKITHNSATEYLPIVSVSPCIVTSTVGGDAGVPSYYYLPVNQAINVRVANAGGGGNIQTIINNSDLFLEIKDLANLGVRSISTTRAGSVASAGGSGPEIYKDQLGSLSSFSTFDISGNTAFIDRGIDFIKLFKTWNNGDKTLPYALTSLNMSGTANSNVRNFPLNLQDDSIGPNGETYYRNPFENLTDIDITNSCITSVSLPENIALYSLRLSGSAISDITLSGQTILQTVDFRNCTVLNRIALDNCSAFKKLELPSLPQLKTIRVTNCEALEEININMANSSNELSISIDNTPNLKKFTLIHSYNNNCSVYINATGLEEVSLEDCQFENISINADSRQTLKYLNLKDSIIKHINWIGENIPQDVLDLSECPYLINGGINISNNVAIEKIQLPNEENNPIPLNFEFSGCTNLSRIFGNILVNKANMFKDCRNFTIHGGYFRVEETDYPVIDSNGRQKLLWDGNYIYQDPAGFADKFPDLFQSGKGVTNLVINTISPTSAFQNTACDAFDVYYVLWHIGPATNLTGLFQYCRNIKMNIELVNGTYIDNSPKISMFSKCGNVTSINSIFRYCDNFTNYYLWGRDWLNVAGRYIMQNGILQYLKNCNDFSYAFPGNFACSPNVFCTLPTKLTDQDTVICGPYFADGGIININGFSPKLLIPKGMSASNLYTYINEPNSLNTDRQKFNFGCINKLTNTLNHFCENTFNVDFTDFKFPAGVTSLSYCFNGFGRCTGTFSNLSDLFKEPDKVTSISYCFNKNRNSFDGVNFNITNDTLSNLVNLTNINNSFMVGNKVIQSSTFPYSLLVPCKDNIVSFNDFFYGVSMPNKVEDVELPGTLFEGCNKLSNVSGCFSNIQFPFKLSQDGFLDTVVTNVSSLFSRCLQIENGIPSRLFNLGLSNSIVTLTGTNIESDTFDIDTTQENVTVSSGINDVTVITIVPGESKTTTIYTGVTYNAPTVTYTPMSKYTTTVQEWVTNHGTSYWDTGTSTTDYIQSIDHWNPDTITFDVKTPVKRISNISSCFYGCNIPAYQHTLISDLNDPDTDVEGNPDYCPFKYVYKNGRWELGGDNYQRYTYIWAYDGNPENKITTNPELYEFLDEDVYSVARLNNNNTSNRFCCAPDLLRWCTSNCNVTSLFSGSGSNSESIYGNVSGINGRIPPYLLKPVPNITSISNMFNWCNTLTSYSLEENGQFYLIPREFFKYTPLLNDLSGTFAGLDFVSPGALTNFAIDLKEWLNIEGIFSNCIWGNNSSNNYITISSVFSSNKIDNARSAFVQGTGGEPNSSARGRYQYVSFENIFSTDRTKHNFDKDYYIFYGYASGCAVHEPANNAVTTASVNGVPIAGRYNYKYYNE